MAKSGNFRKHHQDLQDLAGQITERLDPAQLKIDSGMLRETNNLLAMLRGKLAIHLSIEDMVLYPRLLRDSDRHVKDMAQKYHDEVGSLAKVYEQYHQKWSIPEAIQANPEQFSAETKRLFEALEKRIAREEMELYPLYDRLPGGRGGQPMQSAA